LKFSLSSFAFSTQRSRHLAGVLLYNLSWLFSCSWESEANAAKYYRIFKKNSCIH